MLFMRDSRHKMALLAALAVVLMVGLAILYVQRGGESLGAGPRTATSAELNDALKAFVDAANAASGIESGTAYGYAFVGTGRPANFSIVHCRDEVRCDVRDGATVAKFQQPNTPSPDSAEVDAATAQVVSFHRAVPGFAGGELPQREIERIVRDFLARVYPDFASIEPTLTLSSGMKGVRLNNGNYFFRWEDAQYAPPEGLSAEVQPFIQVGITASGFIFSYDNTIGLARAALAQIACAAAPSRIPDAEQVFARMSADIDARLGGHPIDSGYDPEMVRRAYPGLIAADFACAEATQGRYILIGDAIAFDSTAGNTVSTAERGLTLEGISHILRHAAARLALPLAGTADADALLDALATPRP